MRRFRISALFILCSISGFSRDFYVFTAAEYAPYNYPVDGTPAGIEAEVLEAVSRVVGFEYEIRFLPWARCLKEMEAGYSDAVMNIAYSRDRARYLYYSRYPASYGNKTLVTTRPDVLTLAKESLPTVKVGIVRDFVYGDWFLDIADLDLDRSATVYEMLDKLSTGRFDFGITTPYVVRQYLSDNPEISIYLTSMVISEDRFYFGVSKNGSAPRKLLRHLNRGLKIIRENGTQETIFRSYE